MQRSLRTEGNGAVRRKTRFFPLGNIWAICFFSNPYKVMSTTIAVPSCPGVGGWGLITTWPGWTGSFSRLQGPFTPLTVYITPLYHLWDSTLPLPCWVDASFLDGYSTAPEAGKLTRSPGRLGISSGHILSALGIYCQASLHFCASDGDKVLLPGDLIS